MKFRATHKTPKNDGLPIVNGRKVVRRGRGGRQNADGRIHAGIYRGSCISWIVVAVVLSVLVYVDMSKETATETAAFPATKPAVSTPVVSTPVVSTPAASTPAVSTPTVSTPAVSASSSAGAFPNGCTVEQLALAKKQLPTHSESDKWWTDSSFTIATTRSGFPQNPILMREFYASKDFRLNTKEHSFFGVVLGWQNNDIPVDTLSVGSRDAKFNTLQWNTKLGVSTSKVRSPIAIDSAAEKRPARVLVVDWDKPKRPKPPISLQQLKTAFGYTDDELVLETIDINGTPVKNSLTDLIRSKMPVNNGKVAADQPIHYLEMEASDGEDVKILSNLLPDLLKDVRYLHFEFNKVGSWYPRGAPKLSNVMKDLKKEGFVCYWSGKKESDYGLWRITDCFLDYYDQPHWAYIACVNAMHDDVKELANRMEKKFLETLRMDHVFKV